MRIHVTKSFLPPYDEYEEYLKEVWNDGQLTNQGKLVQALEKKLESYLDLSHLQFVSNGTLALQLGLRALGVEGAEVITTPFSYVATTSAIMWEHSTPVFVDIDQKTLCLDPAKIEAAITPRTKAIMPVHVFGNLCHIEAISEIAKKHKLKVIYDAAHTFGVKYKNKSALAYGDISICSFHATKLFHTIEGGLVVSSTQELNDKIELMKRFGHTGDEHYMLGINAKASEFQAAMGLVNLKHIDDIIESRRNISEMYDSLLVASKVVPIRPRKDIEYNYAYYPVMFESELALRQAFEELAKKEIYARRYFYPSLNTLPYLKDVVTCPISEDVASRIACLPLYASIEEEVVREIGTILSKEKNG